MHKDFKLIERDANYIVISGKIQNTEMQQAQFYTIKNNKAYFLTFSSLQSDFEKYKKVFFDLAKKLFSQLNSEALTNRST